MSDVKIVRKLGEGGFGSVYLMKFNTANQVALKVIEHGNVGEMEILRKIDHKHIVKFYDGYKYKNNVFLLLEFCQGTDLQKYLEPRKPSQYLTELEVLKFATQVASAIVYLHENDVIHRDIKPANILLSKAEHVKLTDFGLSKQFLTSSIMTKTYCGTPLYMAPELLKHKGYSYKADSWSYGCVCHELMCLDHAFQQDKKDVSVKKTLEILLSQPQSTIPAGKYCPKLTELVDGLLVEDVKKRLDMKDAFSSLQGMRKGVTDVVPPTPKIHKLPDAKAVMEAYTKF